jgi:hypothetical protein
VPYTPRTWPRGVHRLAAATAGVPSPQVQLVTAAGCGTRALADAVLGLGWRKGPGGAECTDGAVVSS